MDESIMEESFIYYDLLIISYWVLYFLFPFFSQTF